ncbi:hypothetical protein TNCV_1125581 [Trichonephila clavipes]|nr:hypothetical protein TNCV_1125581 [Trichonephila clavipes]
MKGLKLASIKRRWLDGYKRHRKWSPGYGINSKQVVFSPERSVKVESEQRHLQEIAIGIKGMTTSADNNLSACL